MSYESAEMDRRLSTLVQAGTIQAVDYEAARCRVQVGDWTSAWLPWGSVAAGQVRNWRPPSVGEQALILAPSGLPEGGFVMPGFYTTQHQAANDNRPNVTAQTWPDGAREHYDHDAHEYMLTVPAGGRIVLNIGQTTLELRDEGTTLTTPKLEVDSESSTFTGTVLVMKLLSYLKGLAGKGGGSAGAVIEGGVNIDGPVKVDGDVEATGKIIDAGGNTPNHTH